MSHFLARKSILKPKLKRESREARHPNKYKTKLLGKGKEGKAKVWLKKEEKGKRESGATPQNG